MKRIFSGIALAIAIALSASHTSCSDGKSAKAAADPGENRMVVTAKDSAAVSNLVTSFMNHVLLQEYDEALGMLCKTDFDDREGEPYPLPADNRKEIERMITLPVTGYEITEMVFDTPKDNEVRCRVELGGKIATKWCFKPVRYLGNWSLCVKDSSEGDRPLPDGK